MNKYLLTLAVVFAIPAISYAQKDFVISGTTPAGKLNGKLVYLQELGEGYKQRINIDSTTVANNSFTFKGTAPDEASIGLVALAEPEGRIRQAMFVFDGGNIKMDFDTISSVKGTSLNDEYQSYVDTSTKYAQEDNIDMYSQLTYDYAKKYIKMPLGEFFFLSTSYLYEPTQLRELLGLTRDEFKETPVYATLNDRCTKLENTAVGKTYTDVKGKTPDNKDIALSDYIGKSKYVLIDFWASWCGPCRKEMPNIVDAYAKYKSKGFEIVGISLDTDVNKWSDSVAKLNITWPQMSDLNGWKSLLSAPYGVSSIPNTVIIDDKGTIVARGLYGEELLEKLEDLFK